MESDDSSNLKNNKKKTEAVAKFFDKEIARLPLELKEKLQKQRQFFDDLAKVINDKTKNKSMGFYVNVEMEVKNNQPIPNFDKLTFNFLFDDYEMPISVFDPRLLLGDDFDKYLVEEKKKGKDGQDYFEYKFKANQSIKFEGTSISHLRENCFDAIYDDLKKLGSSFVYEDSRGFISALKSIDIHRNMLLQKFEKYIVVYAGAGSWLRGEKSNDFDVFIVVDDTDVKRMPRMQVKDQLTRIVWQMAAEVAQLTGVNIHCQVFLLTDFWDALKDAHPVMFTFLRDGVPFYDRGIYSAWKELLKLGKIRPSAEAIDMHMNVGTQLIDRAKKMFWEIVMNDIYYSVLNPSQAILMLKGYNPTTPKETVKMFKEVLLAKEKCITQKEVQILEDTLNLVKKIEHDRDNINITGKDIDKMIKDSENFLKKIKVMFEEITAEKTKESILSIYGELLNQIRSLPSFENIKDEDLIKKFEKDLISNGKIRAFVKDAIKDLVKAKKDYEKGTLTITEVNKVLKEIRNVLSEIKEYKNRGISSDFDKKRLLVNYGEDKVAEIINYDEKLYLIDLTHNKGYLISGKDYSSLKISDMNFTDTSKYKKLKLDESLISVVKNILKCEEIFL